MKKILQNHNSYIFIITLCLTMICWIFLFVQLISSHLLLPAQKAIPAFQSIANSNFQNTPDKNTVCSLLKTYDSDIRLVSCHKEKNYTDLYFYSPAIQKEKTGNSSRNFNVQAVITKKYIYFGSPFIQYDF